MENVQRAHRLSEKRHAAEWSYDARAPRHADLQVRSLRRWVPAVTPPAADGLTLTSEQSAVRPFTVCSAATGQAVYRMAAAARSGSRAEQQTLFAKEGFLVACRSYRRMAMLSCDTWLYRGCLPSPQAARQVGHMTRAPYDMRTFRFSLYVDG